jgi:probable HAF family extracellular repeat protein
LDITQSLPRPTVSETEMDPVRLAAQQHIRYKVTDLGTLGGTFSFGVGINNEGWVAGFSTLPGDLNQHAFLWRNGNLTDLGTLGGPNSGPSFSPFSERGDVGAEAETSTPDPNGENFCGSSMICQPFRGGAVWRTTSRRCWIASLDCNRDAPGGNVSAQSRSRTVLRQAE